MALKLAAGSVLAGAAANAGAQPAADAALRAELQGLAGLRIFFGHQSVGDNLLDGLRQLAAVAQVPLHIVEQAQVAGLPAGPVLGHTHLAENTQPLRKLQSFEAAMGSRDTGLDLALLKFCFIDFTPDTDVQALFAQYQATLARVRARHPRTRLVHVTTPLTVAQGGVPALLKRLVGRAPYGVRENQRREDYNQLLRRAYGGREPLFDLAQAESHAADGSASVAEWDGRRIPSLLTAYSSDGAHLNTLGQAQVARLWAGSLIRAARQGRA